jgi:hypothetical protein
MNVSEKLRRLSQSTDSMLRVVHLRGDLVGMAIEVKALEDKIADLQLHGEAVEEAVKGAAPLMVPDQDTMIADIKEHLHAARTVRVIQVGWSGKVYSTILHGPWFPQNVYPQEIILYAEVVKHDHQQGNVVNAPALICAHIDRQKAGVALLSANKPKCEPPATGEGR